MLWKITDQPLHSALMGAHICRHISSHINTTGLRKEVTSLGASMEEWAWGNINAVLDQKVGTRCHTALAFAFDYTSSWRRTLRSLPLLTLRHCI